MKPSLTNGALTGDFTRAKHLEEEGVDSVIVLLDGRRQMSRHSESVIVELSAPPQNEERLGHDD